MHDELGQALTAIKMDVAWVASQTPLQLEPLRQKTLAIAQSLDHTMQSVQRISAELRPNLLDDLGLSAALEWQAEEFRRRSGIEYELLFSPREIVVDRERSTAIFRIFQEALTNIARHAHATQIKASLAKFDHKLVLKIRDNGQGITAAKISDPHSYGLIGMRERLLPVQGKIFVKGRLGKGTVLLFSVPIK